ncbi:MAG: ring-cleaving dioxygenase [Chloroflexaceae bacterium]|nr:ring-cleaving dioxygenase [Chloroflexaceae bacterium]
MSLHFAGLHHITAIVDEPQDNVNFYAGVLGLRLIKRTVNFDDPNTYHLYFGDEVGSPGSIVTFFPWPGAPHGTRGAGQVSAFALAIPEASVAYWEQRLTDSGITFGGPEQRFNERVLSFYDPAGLLVELVTHPDATNMHGWTGAEVPAAYAIRGLHVVTLTVQQADASVRVLTEAMGFRYLATEGDRARYVTAEGGVGAIVDVIARPDLPFGRVAVGSVHHIAWRTPNDDEQARWRRHLIQHGMMVTEVRDRQYFHSIYYREPGGVLYEIATDNPGFAFDEPVETLGTTLKLPPWLEPRRESLERTLLPLDVPNQS